MSASSSVANPQADFVDLHTHSTASDGSLTPADVVAAARAAGLVAMALTDHDTIDGLETATAAGKALGIRVVWGVELSAVDGEVETHLLGLHLGETVEIEQCLVELRDMRRSRVTRIVDLLNALGVRVTFESVAERSGGGSMGRPHVARAMIAEGWATDFRDAFERYLGSGKPAFVAKEPFPIAKAVAVIHGAGGLAMVAHPGHAGSRARVEALVNAGIDGIEVLHPSHSAEDVVRLGTLADHFGLVRTGGSDWHGLAGGARVIGRMRVPVEWLRTQDARVSAARSVQGGVTTMYDGPG